MGKDKKRKKDKKSKKKSRKRDSSSDSSSSSDSENEIERRQRMAEKKARKLGKKLKTGTIAGYTNEENPFGDANLTERFVWHKKLEKQIADGVDLKELGVRAEKKKQESRVEEIERVKKRRTDRETEKAQQEEEKDLMNRERAIAEAVELEKKEEEFHQSQAKERTTIRLKEGRAKPIDILYKNLNARPEEFDLSAEDPMLIFAGLSTREMEALAGEIKMHMEVEACSEEHRAFWGSLLVVCEAETADTRKREAQDRARYARYAMMGGGGGGAGQVDEAEAPYEAGLHASVDADVQDMLRGKDYYQLQDLEDEVEEMRSAGDGEVEYWEAVLKRVRVRKARAHLSLVDYKLREAAKAVDEPTDARHWTEEFQKERAQREKEREDREEERGDERMESEWDRPDSPRSQDDDDAHTVAFSPLLMPEDEAPEGEVVEAWIDDKELHALRKEVAASHGRMFTIAAQDASLQAPVASGDTMYRKMVSTRAETGGRPEGAFGMYSHIMVTHPTEEVDEQGRTSASKMMGAVQQGEVEFRGEINLEKQAYWWHDKYRPRKPKYFNRVHTGYEWNKYNQTHYDHDNPPPKVVQGYKFNIFFPDLIDKTQAPTYEVVDDGSKHSETAMIIFKAGPPYEDIAFKIVNKDWEYSHRKGFKCSFERGILHLYFNFRRYRFRR